MDKLYAEIINSMSEGVIVTLFDGKISFCNEAAAAALSCPREKLIGSSVAKLMSEFEENDAFFELVLDAIYTKEKVSKTVPFFVDGDMKYLRVTTSLMSENGTNSGLVIVISDETDEVQLFISNKRLAKQVIDLMDSFVEVMVTEIEKAW